MSPIVAAGLAFVAYFLAYRFYSSFLARRLFQLDPDALTNADNILDAQWFMNQTVLAPPDVSGYQQGLAWVSSQSIRLSACSRTASIRAAPSLLPSNAAAISRIG